MDDLLRYTSPAGEWLSGLPIGNGRLAAMVWGDDGQDLLTLNHEWLWRGRNRTKTPPDSAGFLPEVRRLLIAGDYAAATALANDAFGGMGGISGVKNKVDPYQVAGVLSFRPLGAAFLSRSLDISSGIARVERSGGICGEFFASCFGGGICASYRAERAFSAELALSRCDDPGAECSCGYENGALTFSCAFDGGISYRISSKIVSDGRISFDGGICRVADAGYIEVFTDITTDVRPGAAAGFLPYAEERAAHAAKFSAAMGAFSLSLDAAEDSPLTTDRRVEAVRAGADDVGIQLLYFNYGRYLLYSSSILGELPANLQGKWNDRIDPPWECDYHFDINLQMNYWCAEPLGMPECVGALATYIKSFSESARRAAKRIYGCRGIWMPIQTDAWGVSTPEAKGWAVWIGAAPWIARHLWKHYAYSGDLAFLRDSAYDFFRGVAEFYEDYLVEMDGRLEILPSQSPENRFEGSGDLPVSIGISSAMDVQLAFDALGYAIDSAELLGVDRERAEKWRTMRSKLPPFRIGGDGRLLEWNEEKTEVEPGHRHLSHLYGLYPGELFTPEGRPAQYDAAIASLRARLSHGGGHTGWSRAWVTAIMARIGDRDGFSEHYTALIKDFATVSLLDLHPPRIFQIDGNLGGTAAVAEALLSPADRKLRLLHGVPREWLSGGSVRGMRAEGGHTLDFSWKNGRVTDIRVRLGYSGSAAVVADGREFSFSGEPGSCRAVKL